MSVGRVIQVCNVTNQMDHTVVGKGGGNDAVSFIWFVEKKKKRL